MNQMPENQFTAVILAAGKGTRMKSELPKVAILLAGKALVLHVLENLQKAGSTSQVVVVGYKQEVVRSLLQNQTNLVFAEQPEQLGTGHALLCAESQLPHDESLVLVACGDAPLITEHSFRNLIELHLEKKYEATILTAILDNPTGYGRILRAPDESVLGIVEEKDASPEQRSIQEINTGTYVFRASSLWKALRSVGNQNAQKEYYLTDVIRILQSEGHPVGAIPVQNPRESHGINSPQDLSLAEEYLHQGLVHK